MHDEWYGVASYLVVGGVIYEQESTCEYDGCQYSVTVGKKSKHSYEENPINLH